MERNGGCRRQGVGSPLPHWEQKENKMKWKLRHTLTLSALCLLSCSCSVKEDRQPCPCWLDVVVNGCLPLSRNLTVSAWNGAAVFTEGIDILDYPDYYERTVPKGYVTVAAFAGRIVQEMEGESLIIPDGKPCDSLFVHHALVDCRGEFARDTVVLHKQFATVYLRIDNLADGETYPYDLVLNSSFDGLRITDCSPHGGPWTFTLKSLTDGSYRFRVPRQGDGSLTLDLYMEGNFIDSYPIGEHIIKAGYSWLSEDLDDIHISMDYGRSEPHIIIDPWGDGAVYDEVI